MGQPFNKQTLDEMIEEVDEDKSGRLEFEEFIILAAKFIVEEDDEAMAKELREAFRLYDKEGNGFIPTSCLKEILRELDDQLSNTELDGTIIKHNLLSNNNTDISTFSYSQAWLLKLIQMVQELLISMVSFVIQSY